MNDTQVEVEQWECLTESFGFDKVAVLFIVCLDLGTNFGTVVQRVDVFVAAQVFVNQFFPE
jgi:hypothetical protein